MESILNQPLNIIEHVQLRHILDEMAETGKDKVVMSFTAADSKAVAAVILVRGENTQEILDALNGASESLSKPMPREGAAAQALAWLVSQAECLADLHETGYEKIRGAESALSAAMVSEGHALVPVRPDQPRIDAGAQRLVSWDVGCIWPDSWDPMQVAAARQYAERVYLEMVNFNATALSPAISEATDG